MAITPGVPIVMATATAWKPQVGDLVKFQGGGAKSGAPPGVDFPRWNGGSDEGGKPASWIYAKVVDENDGTGFFCTEYTAGNHGVRWWWPLPGTSKWDASRSGWIQPVDDEATATVSTSDGDPFEEVTVETIKIVHRERVGQGEVYAVPTSVGQEAIERGEKQIRRTMREWPYDHDLHKRLVQDKDGVIWIEWAFFSQYDGGEDMARDWCSEQFIGMIT